MVRDGEKYGDIYQFLTVSINFRALVDGQIMGSCDAPRRAAAKEATAVQALKRLGLE